MRFQLVGLSTPSVSTLRLKDPQMVDDTIYLELHQTVGVVRWNELPGCWQLKDKKISPLTIKNYSLKHISLTMIYIYIYIYEIVSLFAYEQSISVIQFFGD